MKQIGDDLGIAPTEGLIKKLDSGVEKEWIEITTPFLDRHNDYFQIYVRQEDKDRFLLTDGGYTVSDMICHDYTTGFDSVNEGHADKIFSIARNKLGIEIDNDQNLYIYASLKDLPKKKAVLIQAMIVLHSIIR